MQVSEVKANMLKPVMFRGGKYKLIGYIYWIDQKERKAKHSVEIQDLKAPNCVVRAAIEEVKVIENE